MSDSPTSAQYRLGVKIGQAACDAYAAGATHDEVIETLRHQVAIVERNKDFGFPESSFASSPAGKARADASAGLT